MPNPTGFKEFGRQGPLMRSSADRIRDYTEFYEEWPEGKIRKQGARCMNCAVPFCHSGCPLGNVIPDWNDLVYRGRWKDALASLLATNNFPEFTGRICPAPCEASCVLSINQDPVTIEYIEKAIADRGFQEGWITAQVPERRTGKRVAVVGSDPTGLAAAQQLNRAGHHITVFERDERPGGLLVFGIPDFKLEKSVVNRRIALMEQEGVEFRTGVNVGIDYPVEDLRTVFDAVCLCGGATQARELDIPGSDLEGVHMAMEYLSQQNRLVSGDPIYPARHITAKGKRVMILAEAIPGRTAWEPPSARDANGRASMREIPGSEFESDVDLVLLAMGFLHPVHEGMLDRLGLALDHRGNVKVDGTRMTSVPGVFAAGDMDRGQSLVVWAIAEGREAAHHIDRYLMGSIMLPRSLR